MVAKVKAILLVCHGGQDATHGLHFVFEGHRCTLESSYFLPHQVVPGNGVGGSNISGKIVAGCHLDMALEEGLPIT